jgi:hypothetical protein
MPTLAKTKKPARRVVKPTLRRRPAAPAVALPPAKCSADDLLRALDDGSYAKSTAGIDWNKVERAVKGRRSARMLHAA